LLLLRYVHQQYSVQLYCLLCQIPCELLFSLAVQQYNLQQQIWL
jgi:hypothetical protein